MLNAFPGGCATADGFALPSPRFKAASERADMVIIAERVHRLVGQ
jgi:hypothetical protein